MDIVNNKEDKAAYELFKEEFHKRGERYSIGSSVCSGALLSKDGTLKTNRSAPCHGWVDGYFRAVMDRGGNKIPYIATSLRYYRPSKSEYTYYNYIDPSVEITPEIQKRYFEDLLSCDSFKSCWEESVVIPGVDKTEDFLMIKVTKDNIAYLATFLVLTRHPYEQKVVDKGSSPGTLSTLGLFSSWYWLCYKDDMKFEEIIPLMTTSGIRGTNVYTNHYPHSHCAIDGVLSTFYPNSNKGDFGFSRANFDFLPIQKIKDGLKAKQQEDLIGYFKNTLLYHGLNGRKGSEDKKGSSMDNSILLGPISDMKNLIRTFNFNVYGKKI